MVCSASPQGPHWGWFASKDEINVPIALSAFRDGRRRNRLYTRAGSAACAWFSGGRRPPVLALTVDASCLVGVAYVFCTET